MSACIDAGRQVLAHSQMHWPLGLQICLRDQDCPQGHQQERCSQYMLVNKRSALLHFALRLSLVSLLCIRTTASCMSRTQGPVGSALTDAPCTQAAIWILSSQHDALLHVLTNKQHLIVQLSFEDFQPCCVQVNRGRTCELEGRLAIVGKTLVQQDTELADMSQQLKSAVCEVSLQQEMAAAKQSSNQVQCKLAACVWTWSLHTDYICIQGLGMADRYVLVRSHFLDICWAALNHH